MLLLADGGLRPGAALWIPDDMLLNRGLGKPGLGSLDPNVSTGEKRVWTVDTVFIHISHSEGFALYAAKSEMVYIHRLH